MEALTKEEITIKLIFGAIIVFLGILAKLLWKWGAKLLGWMFKTERKKFSAELLEEFLPIIQEKLVPIISQALKEEIVPLKEDIDKLDEDNKKRYDSLERRVEHYNRNIRAGKQGMMLINIDCVNKIHDILEHGDLSNQETIEILKDQKTILNYLASQMKVNRDDEDKG